MRLVVVILLMFTSFSAHAYIGPGLGLGVIGALLGGVLAVLLAMAGLVWYPLKRLFKKKKAAENGLEDSNEEMPEKQAQQEIEQRNDA